VPHLYAECYPSATAHDPNKATYQTLHGKRLVHYFSRYPEVQALNSTTSSSIINALKNIFSQFGIPEVVISGNGPQHASNEFAEIAKAYDFKHVTCSPPFAQSNGQVERTIQTLKRFIKESKDPYMALLAYRSTPFPWCKLSPSELLMERCLCSNIPILKEQLTPEWMYLGEFHKQNLEFKMSTETRLRFIPWCMLLNSNPKQHKRTDYLR